jgi:hypothetical protein
VLDDLSLGEGIPYIIRVALMAERKVVAVRNVGVVDRAPRGWWFGSRLPWFGSRC